jgi:hypothetical protein
LDKTFTYSNNNSTVKKQTKNLIESEKKQDHKEDNKEQEQISTQEIKDKLMDELVIYKKELEKLKKMNKQNELHKEIHKYNEIKDVAQALLGHIASHKRKPVKVLYEELGISDDDKEED